MTTPYEKAKGHSEEKLAALRGVVASPAPADAAVITCGSFARREASPLSDVDYFVVIPGSKGEKGAVPSWLEALDKAILNIVPKPHGSGKSFGEIEYHDDMLKNIGGDDDTNAKLSRRILLLLEGAWLSNESVFKVLRKEILSRYIKSTITDHQLALFLLNDIIRYYRTIAVDYEFKTIEASKPWAIRNIKLMYSRKLLYASGLFSVAMTADLAYEEKISRLESLFDMPVIDRMILICGRSAMERVLLCYNHFLEQIEDEELRRHLDTLPPDKSGRADAKFRKLKNEGHHFTRHCLALFEHTFGSTHPIRKAVIF